MQNWCTIEDAAKAFQISVEKAQELIDRHSIVTKTDESGGVLYDKHDLEVTLEIELGWDLVIEDVTASSNPVEAPIQPTPSGPIRFQKKKTGLEFPISVEEAAKRMGVPLLIVQKMIADGSLAHQMIETPGGKEVMVETEDVHKHAWELVTQRSKLSREEALKAKALRKQQKEQEIENHPPAARKELKGWHIDWWIELIILQLRELFK